MDVDCVVIGKHHRGLYIGYRDGSVWSEWYTGEKSKLTGRGSNIMKQARMKMAEAFVSNPAGFQFVKCIDGDLYNLHPTNLRWCSKDAFYYHGSQSQMAVTARNVERFPRAYDHILKPKIEIPETITIRSIV